MKKQDKLAIAKDVKPCAVLAAVTPENCAESLRKIRRALFSTSVSRIRRKAAQHPVTSGEIDEIVGESRKTRGGRT